MIIERHKVNDKLAKALDAANLSQYATLEIPYEDFTVEFERLKKQSPKSAVEDLNILATINIAKRLYGGDRSAVSF